MRALRAVFAGGDIVDERPFARLTRGYALAVNCVKGFYLLSVLFVSMQVMTWHNLALPAPELDYVWPIVWAQPISTLVFVDVVSTLCILFALGAFMRTDSFVLRAGFCITFLFIASVPASLGGVNHGLHEWFWISLILTFLPNVKSRSTQLAYCVTVGAAQAIVLLFYSMAGVWKVLYGFITFIVGMPGNFSYGSLSWTLARRSVQTGTDPLLAPFLINSPSLTTPMFYALMYVQTVSLLVAFRPSLHVAWGALLILFHIGTFLILEISFPSHIAILAVFFLASPFRPKQVAIDRMIGALPVFGFVYRTLKNRVVLRTAA